MVNVMESGEDRSSGCQTTRTVQFNVQLRDLFFTYKCDKGNETTIQRHLTQLDQLCV